jgi:hypothetical protein
MLNHFFLTADVRTPLKLIRYEIRTLLYKWQRNNDERLTNFQHIKDKMPSMLVPKL